MKIKSLIFEEVKAIVKTSQLEYADKGNQLFLKIGNNIDSPSAFGLGDEWKKETGKNFESGVSCFFISKRGDKYFISKPDQSQALYGLKDYFQNMFLDVLLIPLVLGQINIAKGELIPIQNQDFAEWYSETYPDEVDENTKFYDYLTGSDGEPLLKVNTVSVVEKIDPIQFLENFYINDGYRVLDLFMDNVNRLFDADFPDETSDEFIDYLNLKIKEKRSRK